MATNGGPNITSNGLIFGYDTGYPLVSDNHESYKYFKGQPTETFDVGDMTPSSPNTYYTSSYESGLLNLNGTLWDWYVYPNTNVSTEGGMEWHPSVQGPGFTGAWLMKKRPGGNSESNFQGNPPGAIEETAPYTVSVWCKTDQANCFRIHINVTQNGSSYWGYSSTYHSGGGNWERLSVTVPANSGNTSINIIRCQGVGTTVTANAYFRNYQIEKNPHPTPFILGGTRSVSGSLIDLTRTTDIDLTNVSFDSNAQMTFDGTDDGITGQPVPHSYLSSSAIEVVVNPNTISNKKMIGGYRHNNGYSFPTVGSIYLLDNKFNASVITTTEVYRTVASNNITANRYYHVVLNKDTVNGQLEIFVNGVSEGTVSFDAATYGQWATVGSYIGANTLDIGISTNVNAGQGWNNSTLNGQIPIFKVYNRILSTSEVLQNYNALKSRFGL